MGTYLRFKLEDPKQAQKANEVFLKHTQSTYIWDEKDREAELKKVETEGRGCPDYLPIGSGNFKVSGADEYMGKDFPPFLKAVKEIRHTVCDISFLDSNDVTDYLNNKQLIDTFGKDGFMAWQERDKRETYEFDHDKKIIEASREWQDKSVHNTILTVGSWGPEGSMIGVLYGKVDMPTFLKVHPKEKLFNSIQVYGALEKTKEGHGIMLVPLQTLDGYFPQEDGTKLEVFDIIQRMFDIGVRDNLHYILYHLYKRTLSLDGLKSLELNECQYFTPDRLKEEFDRTWNKYGKQPSAINYTYHNEFRSIYRKQGLKWKPVLVAKSHLYNTDIMYLQTLIIMYELMGCNISREELFELHKV